MTSLKETLGHYTWDIAYGSYTPEILSKGLNRSKINIVRNPYINKWFADPFILEDNPDAIELLVEEFDYSVQKGRIARLKINKKNHTIVECSIILELPTHLSFPVIYRRNGEIYVHPENSASGASYIYRYDRATDKLVDPQLMINEPLTDAIIRPEGKSYRMFATRVPDSNGCVLHEYSSEKFFGPYQHCGENIYPNNTARMAGMFIENNGMIVRPSQDCLNGYGNAVIIYDCHTPLCRIAPNTLKYAGIHTFNTFNGSFVIDLKKYDYPLLYKFIKKIKG